MTNKQHPITPPPELAQTLWNEMRNAHTEDILASYAWDRAIAKAYRAGADQELEACCEWIRGWYGSGCGELINGLRAARRHEPPSLKKQAYAALDTYIYGEPDPKDKERTYNIIRHALERLKELEAAND